MERRPHEVEKRPAEEGNRAQQARLPRVFEWTFPRMPFRIDCSEQHRGRRRGEMGGVPAADDWPRPRWRLTGPDGGHGWLMAGQGWWQQGRPRWRKNCSDGHSNARMQAKNAQQRILGKCYHKQRMPSTGCSERMLGQRMLEQQMLDRQKVPRPVAMCPQHMPETCPLLLRATGVGDSRITKYRATGHNHSSR